MSSPTISAMASSIDPEPELPVNLDSLPEDAIRCIFASLRAEAKFLRDILRFFAVNKSLRACSTIIETLSLSCLGVHGRRYFRDCRALQIPYTDVGSSTFSYSHASLLATFGWASRLPCLTSLQMNDLSWSGAARLVGYLHAWPLLEQLEVLFPYGSRSVNAPNPHAYQEFANDLSLMLKQGALPRLRFLWLGDVTKQSALGVRAQDDQDELLRCLDIMDDRALLEVLKPTAAIWWMAERASHCRVSTLHQFEYELEHGADLSATVTTNDHEGKARTFNILTWMHHRLGMQAHSLAGHRAVHELLVEKGSAIRPKLACFDVDEEAHLEWSRKWSHKQVEPTSEWVLDEGDPFTSDDEEDDADYCS